MEPNIDCTDNTDEELVKLTLERQGYFAYLMDRYTKPLLRYIGRISNKSGDDAEDLLQDIFIKAYRNLNGFDDKLKFSSWLYRIAHNHVISDFRKRKARLEDVSWSYDDEFLNNLKADFDLNDIVNTKFDQEIVGKVLYKLDLKYREVLELRFWEQMSYREISDVLKKPEGTIATLINRAKDNFRKEIKKYEK